MHEGETETRGHALEHERVEDGNGFIRTFHRNFVGHKFYMAALKGSKQVIEPCSELSNNVRHSPAGF